MGPLQMNILTTVIYGDITCEKRIVGGLVGK